ncbi:MAG: stage III sporulation protein AA [Ruminococcus sp.]|nr:stage III sporulation protein AA [Ruminococcus sp.]
MDHTYLDRTYLRYLFGGVLKAAENFKGDVCEIRLRAGLPLSVTVPGGSLLLNEGGSVSEAGKALYVTYEDVRRTFEAVCRYSVHSFQGSIAKGYITLPGGHRAGLCGSAVMNSSGKTENLRHISSINLRIAREVKGTAEEIADRIKLPCGVLICGEPGAGKTTVLRDLCRIAGNIFPVTLIDEREEIAAVTNGIPGSDVGLQTDILSGFSKPEGIMAAVRSMNPVMLFCDETGGEEDISALEYAYQCGVKTAAAVHCPDPERLIMRTKLYRLFSTGAMDWAVFVKERRITDIVKAGDLGVNYVNRQGGKP